MEVATEVQREVLRHYGLPDDHKGLTALRRAAQENPDIPMYIKYNRAARGRLEVGDTVPNEVRLVLLGQNDVEASSPPKPLHTYAKPGIPLVLICGSYS